MMVKQTHKAKAKKAVKHAADPEVIRGINDDERYAMIAVSAYLLAEQRSFQGDVALDDWLRAELEVSARLRASE